MNLKKHFYFSIFPRRKSGMEWRIMTSRSMNITMRMLSPILHVFEDSKSEVAEDYQKQLECNGLLLRNKYNNH
ncbi:hypothetical protein CS542_06090 [Pedobacter sp. IW39]|nr:hypothetical protein CS542_06090 [Pedobacter sp. IW39]